MLIKNVSVSDINVSSMTGASEITNSYILDCIDVYENSKPDFICTVYYEEDYKAKVVIRRMDKVGEETEEKNVYKGKLFLRIDEYRHDLSGLTTNNDSSLTCMIDTSVKLIKHVYTEQKIPKVIIQTGETRDCEDVLLYNSVMSFIDKNPDYSYVFITAKERREFIKENYEEFVLSAYDTLVPNAFKADLFRYCYLYKNGGCYFDYKMILRVPLHKFIKSDDTFLICSDYEKTNSLNNHTGQSYLNALIFSTPKNELLKNMINACVVNILQNQAYFLQDIQIKGCQGILELTGPTLFYKILSESVKCENTRFKHLIINNDETDYRNFVIVNLEDSSVILSKTYTTVKKDNHYSDLWIQKQVFYQNKRIVKAYPGKTCDKTYTIQVFPHPYPDVFEFSLEGNILIVERYEGGWWVDLRIRIIDNDTSDFYDIHVGRGCETSKTVVLDENIFKNNKQEKEEELFYIHGKVYEEQTVKETDIKVSEIVIAVPSIINVPTERSVISVEDRYTQTLNQLESIMKKVPTATIVLLEMSKKLKEEWMFEIQKRCHYIIRYTNSKKTTLYCREHSQKGLGEMYVLTHFGRLIMGKEFKWFFKFGGRYEFMYNFDINKYTKPIPVCKCLPGNGRLKILAETVFYCIPKEYFELYIAHLTVWLNPNTVEGAEHIFTMFLESVRNILQVPTFNVKGIGATNNVLNVI